MGNSNCKEDFDVSRYIYFANRILASVRDLEYELYDIYSDNEAIEDDLIEIKRRLKVLKMDLCAMKGIRSNPI